MNARSALTFDRWDFLGTRVLLAMIGVALTVFGVAGPLVEWLRAAPCTGLSLPANRRH